MLVAFESFARVRDVAVGGVDCQVSDKNANGKAGLPEHARVFDLYL